MIDSKKLLQFSEKLDNIDRIIEWLNDGKGCFLQVTGAGKEGRIFLNVTSDEKATCELTNQVSKAVAVYKTNIERKIQGLVRP